MSLRVETTPSALRQRLEELNSELAAASFTGLAQDSAYMKDLYAELDETRGALVLASVMEVALRRAQLTGPLNG